MTNTNGTMKMRKLGALEVSSVGLGCMGMSAFYDRGGVTEKDSIELIHKAIDLGINFFDTAEIYGPFTNEELLGKALKGKRDQVIIATKFGFRFENGERAGLDGSAKNVKAAVEGSLRRLNVDVVVPIPGTTKINRLVENCNSVDIALTDTDMAAIDKALEHKAGERYTARNMQFVES